MHYPLRYLLLQLPETVLLVMAVVLVDRWVDLPAWLLWGLAGAFLAIHAVLFPLLWRANRTRRPPVGGSVVGLPGTARDRLDPTGWVRIRGELWRAEIEPGSPHADPGDAIVVTAVEGLQLRVRRAGDGGRRSRSGSVGRPG